ncbi:hypothetical protein [Actinoplanes friuliensis]|uniref:Uncharacterized protein n=1 Tax=Actinoplanes friuliensis DSM 7358 TaxID=1246995 RepID=U5WBS6_9ACTN|nr:hypothetical protein [Actinoplanes friuliensis]AGZ45455.1 hypothetical protein AFR_35995 [Actinoplanes friuliensis DSM 7358]
MKRRQLIGAAAGTALSATTLAGCGLFDDDPEPAPQPDALQPVLDEAVRLAAAYDRVALAQPGLAGRLTPLADDHRAHVAELSRVIGAAVPSGAPASSAPSGDAADSVASLRKAEQAAQKTAAALCRTAPAARAGLVGSIAAARAAHAEALR